MSNPIPLGHTWWQSDEREGWLPFIPLLGDLLKKSFCNIGVSALSNGERDKAVAKVFSSVVEDARIELNDCEGVDFKNHNIHLQDY